MLLASLSNFIHFFLWYFLRLAAGSSVLLCLLWLWRLIWPHLSLILKQGRILQTYDPDDRCQSKHKSNILFHSCMSHTLNPATCLDATCKRVFALPESLWQDFCVPLATITRIIVFSCFWRCPRCQYSSAHHLLLLFLWLFMSCIMCI